MILNDQIQFDADTHRYFGNNNEPLISVTQLINLYKPVFDPDKRILNKCAINKGMAPEELAAQWEKIKVDACIRGTNIHKSIEHFILTNQILNNDIKDIVKEFKKIKFRGKLFPEKILGNIDFGVAGTIDLIEQFDGNVVALYDYKSSKKISAFSPFGNKFLYPIDYLYVNEINTYSLQLSIYSYILEETYGFWVNTLTILWANPKTHKIQPIEVQNRRQDVEKILEHYKKYHSHKNIEELIQKEV